MYTLIELDAEQRVEYRLIRNIDFTKVDFSKEETFDLAHSSVLQQIQSMKKLSTLVKHILFALQQSTTESSIKTVHSLLKVLARLDATNLTKLGDEVAMVLRLAFASAD